MTTRRSARGAPIASTARTASTIVPALLVSGAAVLVWAWAYQYGPHGARFPAAPVPVLTFAVVQVLVPSARWNHDRVLGPGNVALLAFALQLVLLPVVLVLQGPDPGQFAVPATDRHVNAGLALQALAYGAYAVGRMCLPRPRNRPLCFVGRRRHAAIAAAGCVVIGLVGLFLAFPDPAALIDYFAGHADVEEDGGSASLASAAGTFLRPFLAYGFLLAWALVVTRPGRSRPGVLEVSLVLAAIAGSATYGYNRASVIVPILALITAYGVVGRGVRLRRVVVMLIILVGLGYQFGEYRNEYFATEGGQVSRADAGLTGEDDSFLESAQVYANGPQFWGAVVQEVERSGFQEGGTLTGSVLLPVPVLGTPYRDQSGPVEYNALVYGRFDVNDQIIGVGAELYWNFGVPAVVVGYLLVGAAVRRFDDLAGRSVDPLGVYTWSYMGIWVALSAINSISVLAQIAVYFWWPIVAVIVWRRLDTARHQEAVS